MPTYFNYVEREADSYVNWADVGRDMSNTIDDIQRVREEKKALIEKTYREDLKFIQDNPSGEHETLRSWALNMGQSAAEMMRLQNTMLKQGKLSLPNYLSFRQNITDSVEKIYTVNSQLQEAFKEVNDRTKEGGNQQLERETKVLLEKYGKLEDTEAYINPLNGTIYLGLTEIVEEDGKSVKRLKKGDGSYLSPEQLQAAAIQKFDNYDPEPKLIEWAKSLGRVKESLREKGGAEFAGMITSVEDIKGERWRQIAKENNLSEAQIKDVEKFISDFRASEDNFLNGILQIPTNASAILTEKMGINPKTGNPYEIVFNESEQKSSDQLYVEKTKEGLFIPRFDTKYGKEQKDDLREYLRSQLTPKYNRIVEQQTYTEVGAQKQQPQIYPEHYFNRGDKAQKEQDWATDFGLLYYGSPEEKLGVIEKLYQLENVEYARYVEDKNGDVYVEIQQKDTNKKPARGYLIKDGKQQGAKNMTNALVNAALGSDVNAVEFKKRVLDNPLNPNLPEVKEPPKKLTFSEIVETKITPQINGSLLTAKEGVNNTEMAASLNNIFGDTGITAKANGYYGITISYLDSGGKTVSKQFISEFRNNQSQQAETEAAAMRNFVNNYYNNLPTEVKTRYKQKFTTGNKGGSNPAP